MEDKKNPKALLIHIDEVLHSKIKSIAALRNITLRKLILRLIVLEIQKHEDHNQRGVLITPQKKDIMAFLTAAFIVYLIFNAFRGESEDDD